MAIGFRSLLAYWLGGGGALSTTATANLQAVQADQTLAAAGQGLGQGTLSAVQSDQTLVSAATGVGQGTALLTQASQTLSAQGGTASALLNLTVTQATQFSVILVQALPDQTGGLVVTQADQTLTARLNQRVNLVWADPDPVDLVWTAP